MGKRKKKSDLKRTFKAKVIGPAPKWNKKGFKILGRRTVLKDKDTGETFVQLRGKLFKASTRKNPYTGEQMAYINAYL